MSLSPQVKVVWFNWYPNFERHLQNYDKLAKNTAHEINKKLLSIALKANCNI